MQQIGFYCRTYCSLNMFQAPLCPSSGAQDLYRWLMPMVLGALKMENVIYNIQGVPGGMDKTSGECSLC